MFQSHKGGEFPDQINSCQVPQKNSGLCSFKLCGCESNLQLKEGRLLKNIFDGRKAIRKMP
jgi:hypothetical protein